MVINVQQIKAKFHLGANELGLMSPVLWEATDKK